MVLTALAERGGDEHGLGLKAAQQEAVTVHSLAELMEELYGHSGKLPTSEALRKASLSLSELRASNPKLAELLATNFNQAQQIEAGVSPEALLTLRESASDIINQPGGQELLLDMKDVIGNQDLVIDWLEQIFADDQALLDVLKSRSNLMELWFNYLYTGFQIALFDFAKK